MKALLVFLGITVLLVGIFTYINLKRPTIQEDAVTETIGLMVATNSYVYTCAVGGGFTVATDSDAQTILLTRDGTTYTLPRTKTASGVQYQNTSGTVIFSEQEDLVMLEIDGQVLHQGCTIEQPETASVISSSTKLTGYTWLWTKTEYEEASTVTPDKPDVFSVSFSTDGRVAATTDCNSISGSYSAGEDGSLTVAELAMTKMACTEEVQEAVFAEMLSGVAGYSFDEAGALSLRLTATGTAHFVPAPVDMQ